MNLGTGGCAYAGPDIQHCVSGPQLQQADDVVIALQPEVMELVQVAGLLELPGAQPSPALPPGQILSTNLICTAAEQPIMLEVSCARLACVDPVGEGRHPPAVHGVGRAAAHPGWH